jgi:hypothetical protein
MTYNRRITVLVSIIAALALAYALGVVFEPERAGQRSAAYTWLDPKLSGRVDRVSVSGAGEPTELLKKNGAWFVSHNGMEYPAKGPRVEDFIGLLSTRAPYPVRSSASASHERLGLDEDNAFLITVSGGAGLPLLELLVGQPDNTGREVYLRRRGQDEVRSGKDTFSSYVTGQRSAWYDLRLFPDGADGAPELDGVQRLTVHTGAAEPQVFTRAGREWTVSGMTVTNPDMGKIDSYVRGILFTEGDDFSGSVTPDDSLFNDSRITVERGDGGVISIRLGPAGESGRRLAVVSGSEYVYSLAGWAVERLFRDAAYFERQ